MNKTKYIFVLLTFMVFSVALFGFRSQAATVSGYLSDGLNWSYDSDVETLTVSGKGKMENFSSASEAPWYNYRENIKSVVLTAGVRSIGMRAFCGYPSLTVVSLTDSIETVYGAAFYNCKNLVKVFFNGNEFYRERIKVGKNNEYFTAAAVVYKAQDHIHTYEKWEVVTPASVKNNGQKVAECYLCSCVYIYETIPKIAAINMSSRYFSYTSKSIGADFKVTDKNGEILSPDEDYNIKLEDKSNIGKHKATLTFKGCYTGKYSVYYYILPANVSGLTSKSGTDSITLSWNKVKGATGYRIYIYDSELKKYNVLVKKTYSNSYTVKNLSKAKNYVFLVKAYSKTDNGYYYSRTGAKITTCTKVDKCKVVSTAQTTTSVKFSWNKVNGATGYRLYLYDNSSKTYKKLITTSKTYYECSNLKSGKIYVFAIKAYRKAGSTVVWGDIKKYSVATKPERPAQLVSSASVNAVTLHWKKDSSVTGYRIYMYNSVKKTYEPLKIINENKITLYNLKANKNYVFAVKPYISVGNSVVWGNSSKVRVKTERDSINAVVVSSSGSKYHRADCSRAKNANEKMSIASAVERGYSPCSYCF